MAHDSSSTDSYLGEATRTIDTGCSLPRGASSRRNSLLNFFRNPLSRLSMSSTASTRIKAVPAPESMEAEDSGYPHDEDVFEAATRQAAAVSSYDKTELKKIMKSALQIQLCFLVDITGSMSHLIKAVAENIGQIVDALDARCKQYDGLEDFQVAFVGYRDYKDDSAYHPYVLHFTKDIEDFKIKVNAVPAEGGGDQAEDIFTGLQAVAKLGWNDTDCTRLIIHFADAPCHGTYYHDDRAGDDHKGGDLYQRDGAKLLLDLKDNCGVNLYQLVHLNESCRLMVHRFKQHAQSPDWILEENMQLLQASRRSARDAGVMMTSTVVRSVMTSASRTVVYMSSRDTSRPLP